jgi:NAD(P)-dependent dehydrogenase (short-subunit alcohol dehydrogenase family)
MNITATFYTIISFLELLDLGNTLCLGKQQQHAGSTTGMISSQVIATSSITAFNRLAPSGFAYAASKAGETHMLKQLSTLLGPWRIRCNILAPGSEYLTTFSSSIFSSFGCHLPPSPPCPSIALFLVWKSYLNPPSIHPPPFPPKQTPK